MESSRENERGSDTCYRNSQRQVFQNIPADSDVPLPPNPALEGAAGSHHHHGMAGSSNDDNDKVEGPLIGGQSHTDFHNNPQQILDNAGNGILKSHYVSQGKLPTSFGDSILDDVYRNKGQGYRNKGLDYSGVEIQRPPSYLMDYPGLDDYYNEVIQQRSRNRLRKPVYDVYDSPNYDAEFSEFPKNAYSALSRNRNKIFNDKYDEYAANAFSNTPDSEVRDFSAKSENPPKNGVAKVTAKQNHSEEGLPNTGMLVEGIGR